MLDLYQWLPNFIKSTSLSYIMLNQHGIISTKSSKWTMMCISDSSGNDCHTDSKLYWYSA